MTDEPNWYDAGCTSQCRKQHSRMPLYCALVPPPEPTVSMTMIYTDPEDGYPSIGSDTYTAEQLAELIAASFVAPQPGAMLPLDRAAAHGFALQAAKAIIHRHDARPTAPGTITVANPRNTGWYWTCTACEASVGKYSTDDQARAQAAIYHPKCPPDPNGPYAWTIPTATQATGGWTQQDDGTWTLPVDEGTIIFTQATTPEDRERFAAAWAANQQTEPEICGAEPPRETTGTDGRVWLFGDCWCTLKPHRTGEHRCQPCTDRHGAPGWTDETGDTDQGETGDEHVCKPGASLYYCPTSGETESDCHGGFDVCCDRPDLHRPIPAGLRDQLAAAIWERQNPGRHYTDCEHPWQADAEADAEAVLAALTLRLEFGEEQAWCKVCCRVWEGRSHQCESDAEQTVTRVRNECDRLEAAVRDNPTTPDFDGAYLTAIGHVRTALQPPKEPTP